MSIIVDYLRKTTLEFIKNQKLKNGEIGEYRYSSAVSKPTLYSSAYAAMTCSLYHDLDLLTAEEKERWIIYFNLHQDDDGLFRDNVIYNQGWYEGDPLWCGRPHLTCHVITALACLGDIAKKPFKFLKPYMEVDNLVKWLGSRDWGEKVGWTGNEIMNIGTLLQYARDFHCDSKAGKAVCVMLEWLSENHISRETGVWGELDISDPIWRSHAIQAAYHWWPLFFYDNYPIPFIEKAIDTLLRTQNPLGGFGWGVHNPKDPFKSSACEDIDSIDPLARMTQKTAYRRDEIMAVLEKAADWVLQNRIEDGGFVFILDRPFEYGHRELYGEKSKGAMFPTWFRTLSLAVIGKAVPENPLGKYPWNFIMHPGFQFW